MTIEHIVKQLRQIENDLIEYKQQVRIEVAEELKELIYWDISNEILNVGYAPNTEPVGEPITEKGKILLQFRDWFKEAYNIEIDE